ncbi:MAG: triphosphoribosyl-dephospho-CoA synthase [Methylobacteriaceae bacterium]|nr:triphosphoribosyl-dephospho-CoA synthase [Methylobacteriaceae bacterium]
MSPYTSQEIAAAFVASCRDEIEAPKPGNVHAFAGGHDMEARHFLDSARAAAPAIAAPGARVGTRVRDGVEATLTAVGMNTNLGIILLCAPLARAAEMTDDDLRAALAGTLKTLDARDTADVYAAIARASPGGLGRAARYDVHDAAPASLLEAMGEAAERDMIARQYVTDFADIFETGLTMAAQMQARQAKEIALSVYLGFLSRFPDTHIVRKLGLDVATSVMREAQTFATRVQSEAASTVFTADLLAFDARLKAARINPGTSADLTVATLFAARLSRVLPNVILPNVILPMSSWDG